LEQLRQFRYLALAVSVRDAYLDDIKPILTGDVAFATHTGFRGRVAEAARRFFAHYKLPQPNVPILNQEFENPLFLKLLCEALTSRGDLRLSDPPSFSELLEMILDDANARLAIALDYDPAERYVQRAVELLAQMMARQNSDVLSWPNVIDELRKLKPSDTRSRSLAQHLVAEDLLVRVPGADNNQQDRVRFAYQRFSDYSIASELLRSEIANSGSGAETLRRSITQIRNFPAALSWVEALATLSPELGGPELPAVAANFANDAALRSAFLHSVVWRKASAVSAETEKHVRDLFFAGNYEREDTLQALLSVVARPGHALNADWLDRLLRPMSMPQRDAIWSHAIFGAWGEEGAVKRLIDWAWQEQAGVDLPPDVVRLAAMALIWMLTTSDRFVRDRATKALVSLLEHDLQLVIALLDRFVDVSEPYLQERLHAVAYGCAMRATNIDQLGALAQKVYDRTFRSRYPPSSVLLRDHARGIVEVARRRKAPIDYDPELIVPPYRSDPPADPPEDDELRKAFHSDTYDDEYRGTARIYESVTGDDFNHYVIKDITWWSNSLGGVRLRDSPRRLFTLLQDKLPESSREVLQQLSQLYAEGERGSLDAARTKQIQTALQIAERHLPELIGSKHLRLFLSKIRPYLKNRHEPDFTNHFPIERFERLILQRVLDLGWRNDLLGDFDTNVPSAGREPNKQERVGKKYQWIAYDDLHARISDNYGLADTNSEVMHRGQLGARPLAHRSPRYRSIYAAPFNAPRWVGRKPSQLVDAA
jgi:hypothetical protein